VSLLTALVLAFTSPGRGLVRRVVGRRRWWVAAPLLVLVLLAIGRVVTLPFGLVVRGRNLEEGLTEQSLGGWLWDRTLGLGVSWALMSLLVLLVVATARRWPRRWYVVAGGVVAALVFAVSAAYPLVVEPLFNSFTPVREGPLEQRVLALADREGVQVSEVLVADASRRTTTLNAYVSGIGSTRRVVVYDNLVEGVSLDETMSVVAHELAHAKHRDVVVGTGLAALGSWAGVSLLALVLDTAVVRRRAGVTGAADPRVAAAVLALVAVGGLLASPFENAASRAVEARADRTALLATEDPGAFRSVQVQLALRSLADPTPPTLTRLWFGSHPTTLQRLAFPDALGMGKR
jgi:STE24 endopeptidase